MSSSECFPTQFLLTPYEITASSIDIQNIATGKSFIGNYTQNQFTVPVNGGLSTPVRLNVIDPTTNKVVNTIPNQITFSLSKTNECVTNASKTTSYNTQLSGYSQFFGPIKTKVNLKLSGSSLQFTNFSNKINIAFQTTLNGETYSITANDVNIQKA